MKRTRLSIFVQGVNRETAEGVEYMTVNIICMHTLYDDISIVITVHTL